VTASCALDVREELLGCRSDDAHVRAGGPQPVERVVVDVARKDDEYCAIICLPFGDGALEFVAREVAGCEEGDDVDACAVMRRERFGSHAYSSRLANSASSVDRVSKTKL
jgi:hypothetical protein